MNRVVTISREFGSGGREVGRRLAEAMGVAYYDQEVAEASDCVIVGRCADYVLRDLSPVRLFVYADMEHKIARCQEKGDDAEELTVSELRRKIASVDKRRARYYQFYTSQLWGRKEHYDLCINTSRHAQVKDLIPGLAALVERYAKGEGGGC